MKRLLLGVSWCLVFSAVGLLGINVYGLVQDLRPAALSGAQLRFGERDVTLSKNQFKDAVRRVEGESGSAYAGRLAGVISRGMAHIEWDSVDPVEYYQRVPVWENYILWAMSWVTSIPEYKRYHFISTEKSIERGIGICGDASMLMSQLLDAEGIENRIITLPGHVMVEAFLDQKWVLLDPDFGVVGNSSAQSYADDNVRVRDLYLGYGYSRSESELMRRIVSHSPKYWGSVKDFVTKKYYFEKVAYPLKWCTPILLFTVGIAYIRRCRLTHTRENSKERLVAKATI